MTKDELESAWRCLLPYFERWREGRDVWGTETEEALYGALYDLYGPKEKQP